MFNFFIFILIRFWFFSEKPFLILVYDLWAAAFANFLFEFNAKLIVEIALQKQNDFVTNCREVLRILRFLIDLH